LVPNISETTNLFKDAIQKHIDVLWGDEIEKDKVVWLKVNTEWYTPQPEQALDYGNLIKRITAQSGIYRYDGSTWVAQPGKLIWDKSCPLEDIGLYERKVDLNSANVEQLLKLGFTATQTSFILSAREVFGAFKDMKEFRKQLENANNAKGKFKKVKMDRLALTEVDTLIQAVQNRIDQKIMEIRFEK